jgi:hypothetical protein
VAAIADTIMVRIHIIEMAISTIGPAGATGTTAASAILAIGAISEIIIVTDAPKDPMIKDALGAPPPRAYILEALFWAEFSG